MGSHILNRDIDGDAPSLWLDCMDAYVSDVPASAATGAPAIAFPAEDVAALTRFMESGKSRAAADSLPGPEAA